MAFLKIQNFIIAISLTALSLVSQQAQAQDNANKNYALIFFGDAQLRDCQSVEIMTHSECEEKKYLIKYMTTKLLYIFRGYVGGGGQVAGFERVPSDVVKIVENEGKDLGWVDRYFLDESALFHDCLSGPCSELIALRSGAPLNLADRWNEVSQLFYCIAKSRISANFNLRPAGNFVDAKNGIYGSCFSAMISRDVLNVGISISLPSDKF